MSSFPTLDREFFQKVLESAFVLQQMDGQSFCAIREVGRLIRSGELDVDVAKHLIVEGTRKVANTTGVAVGPSFDALLASPGISTPLLTDGQSRVSDSMDEYLEPFRVATPELKSAQFRPRDRLTSLLVILAVLLVALLLGPVLGRATWVGTAHSKGLPPRVTVKPDETPQQPAQAGRADPSPSPSLRLLQRVEPEYPEAAKQQHIQGSVILEARVGKGGTIQQLTVISGNSALATAASDALLKWRFRPFVQNGRAVPFETRIRVHFVLR